MKKQSGSGRLGCVDRRGEKGTEMIVNHLYNYGGSSMNETSYDSQSRVEHKVGRYGYVKLLDWMGTDHDVVAAARVSYEKGNRQVKDDEKLIDYLLSHEHTTPFEMVETKWEVKLPIFVARQWIRHRTASVNEMSARYSVMDDEFGLSEELRVQETTNKQSSLGALSLDDTAYLNERRKEAVDNCYEVYEETIDRGVGREQAREVLPVAIMTKWVWKIDLKNLFHFLNLRTDSHAQKEIRDYADVMSRIVKEMVPLCFAAFVENWRDAKKIRASDVVILKMFLDAKEEGSSKQFRKLLQGILNG